MSLLSKSPEFYCSLSKLNLESLWWWEDSYSILVPQESGRKSRKLNCWQRFLNPFLCFLFHLFCFLFLSSDVPQYLQFLSFSGILQIREFAPFIVVVVQSLSHVWLFVTPLDCSMPGLPVLHCLLKFTQTHVHWLSDAIQPSHSLSFSPFPQSFPASGSFPMSLLLTSGGHSIGASASILPINIEGWFPTVCPLGFHHAYPFFPPCRQANFHFLRPAQRVNPHPLAFWDFPSDAVVENPPAISGDAGDGGSIPVSGRSPWVGHGNTLQYSCLENSMDRGAWWATVHGVPKITEHVCACVRVCVCVCVCAF